MNPSIMFHHFFDAKHPDGQGALSADRFSDIIYRNPEIISADEWYDKFKKNKLKNERCLTFDDNLKCQFDVAYPVLKSLNLKAFWFIYTSPLLGIIERIELYRYFRTTHFEDIESFYKYFFDFIQQSEYWPKIVKAISNVDFDKYLHEYAFYTTNDRKFRYIRDIVLSRHEYYEIFDEIIGQNGIKTNDLINTLWMNADNIKELDNDGQIIGLHSHTHPTKMELLSYSAQAEEYSNNLSLLEGIVGSKKIFSMSHPCSSYNTDTLSVLNKLDIKIGFRANYNYEQVSDLELQRIDHALLKNK
jgi:peptidoglycan/xylan/chitin deacetylase (PgdA/CDA1 family)